MSIVVVTGGASGIGRAICEAFVRTPYCMVCCLDIDKKAADSLSWNAGAAYGSSVFTFEVDVSDADAVSRTIRQISNTGKIDVLVNNAGIQPLESYVPLHKLSEGVWDWVFRVNLKSVFLMSKSCIPHMSRGSSIINMASVTALAGAKNVSAYATTKAAIVGLTKQMAMDYADRGIRVNAVCPGAIDTPMIRRTLEAQTGGKDAASALEALAYAHPMRRIGFPEEVARAVKFLASDDASFITGAVFIVDGGISAKGPWAIEK